jgi:hypothetical protein
MNKKMLSITLLTMAMLFTPACKTLERQAGGEIKAGGKFGSAQVQQPENAKEEATLNYSEDAVTIPMKSGDQLDVTITEKPSGEKTKEVEFRPVNDSDVSITDIFASGDTGYSHKDMALQLDVFLKNTKGIMWFAIALMAGGLIWTLVFKDLKTGGIIGATGGIMLVAYAVLPTVFQSGSIIAGVVLVGLPLLWYLDKKKHERIVRASQKAYEEHKREDRETAKKYSAKFKEHLNPNDIKYLEGMKKRILD